MSAVATKSNTNTAGTLQTYLVTSHDGDTLDCVMYRHNCTHTHDVVLALNPELSALPPVLPYNTTINLPYNLTQKAAVKKRKTLNLWN